MNSGDFLIFFDMTHSISFKETFFACAFGALGVAVSAPLLWIILMILIEQSISNISILEFIFLFFFIAFSALIFSLLSSFFIAIPILYILNRLYLIKKSVLVGIGVISYSSIFLFFWTQREDWMRVDSIPLLFYMATLGGIYGISVYRYFKSILNKKIYRDSDS